VVRGIGRGQPAWPAGQPPGAAARAGSRHTKGDVACATAALWAPQATTVRFVGLLRRVHVRPRSLAGGAPGVGGLAPAPRDPARDVAGDPHREHARRAPDASESSPHARWPRPSKGSACQSGDSSRAGLSVSRRGFEPSAFMT
jgi:hypothetical protein